MSVEIARRAFNVAEYYRMAEAGILHEDDRVELLDGEIVTMSPIGSRHAASVDRLNHLFARAVGGAAIVRVQNPIRLSDFSEPQPDLALLRARDDFYREEHPTPADVLLVVEVAETSTLRDREAKLPLYAAAGIPEVWLIDAVESEIDVHLEPKSGTYRSTRRPARGESLSPQELPGVRVAVDAILG